MMKNKPKLLVFLEQVNFMAVIAKIGQILWYFRVQFKYPLLANIDTHIVLNMWYKW